MASIRSVGVMLFAVLLPALALGQSDSLADLNEAIHRDPSNATALASRGRLFLMMGWNREAVADASASIRLDPKNAGAYGTRGLALDRLGEFPRAIADYTQSIRLHPTALKYDLRGRCYEILGQHDRAIADYRAGQRLTALDPTRVRKPSMTREEHRANTKTSPSP